MCYPNLFGYLNNKNIEHRSKPVDLSNPPIRIPFRLGRQSKECDSELSPLLEKDN